jgi:hypothetical protein
VINEADELDKIVSVLYTNYRGITARRRIIPRRIWFGSTEWHPGEQWILDAFDLEKRAERSFAIADIKAWSANSGTGCKLG